MSVFIAGKTNAVRLILGIVLGTFVCGSVHAAAYDSAAAVSVPAGATIPSTSADTPNAGGSSTAGTSDGSGGDDGAGGGSPPARGKRGSGDDWIIPVVVGVVAVAAAVTAWFFTREEPIPPAQPPDSNVVAQLQRTGPQFPRAFNMSGFAIKGLVKGGWPMVMDFAVDVPAVVQLTVSAQGVPEVYTFPLSHSQRGRRQVKWDLPKEFGHGLRPALIVVHALNPAGRQTMGSFQVAGFGAGPRAVGSVAIDQVLFGPGGIRTSMGEAAVYRFFSRSAFSKVSVEFMKTMKSDQGDPYTLVNSNLIEGVAANRWVGEPERRSWDGYDVRRQVSQGSHKLQVRAWHQAGDWVTAWSQTAVRVVR